MGAQRGIEFLERAITYDLHMQEYLHCLLTG